jgi:phytol kinase
MALILGALGLMLCGVRLLQSAAGVGSETGRKLVHMGMGLIALTLPWLFSNAGPVWLLAALATAALLAVRFIPTFTRHLGGVLGGVQRFSLGEVYFAPGVALAFTLAGGNRAEFCGAVGVLAFADSAGALVGTRWGRLRYPTLGHAKSAEGSAAVFVTSVLCVMVAAAVLGGEAWTVALAGAVLAGVVVTVVEAVASHGLDNLLLPSVVVGFMRIWGGRSTEQWGVITACVAGPVVAFAVWLAVAARQRNPAGD